jgi:acetate kinase
MNETTTLFPEGVISAAAGQVAVHVIPTDEEWMIAKTVCRVLGLI